MWLDMTYRSKEEEIMDDLEMSGDILIDSLDKIATINQWLGGNSLTMKGVREILSGRPQDEKISIVDLGCGNGDMLRALAKMGDRLGYTFELVGIDANAATIDYAIELSRNFDNIRYLKMDVLSTDFADVTFDIALCTLFLHHFENDTAYRFVDALAAQARIGVIINDLHRHPLAYYLFRLITLPLSNPMMKQDGLLSIRKGWRREDFERFASKIKAKHQIRWRWAFRYQWIIQST